MCCIFASLVFVGPRFAILVWWIIDQVRWEAAFSNFFVAFVGWLLVPWTTITYVLVYPNGINGVDHPRSGDRWRLLQLDERRLERTPIPRPLRMTGTRDPEQA